MNRRYVETAAVVASFALLLAIALGRSGPQAASTYSTYDTGRNGYRALYDVLLREGVTVSRFEAPLSTLKKPVQIVAFTSARVERFAPRHADDADLIDVAALKTFARSGGRIVFFGDPTAAFRKALSGSLRVYPADRFSNSGLQRHPAAAFAVVASFQGRVVAFDERFHGYAREASMWSVLPQPVRFGFLLAVLALMLWLVDANVRWRPAAALEPPDAGTSESYIASMAMLLKRAGARAAVFEALAEGRHEVNGLRGRVGDAALVRVARLFVRRRKEPS